MISQSASFLTFMTGKKGWTNRFSSEEIVSTVREGFEPSVAFWATAL